MASLTNKKNCQEPENTFYVKGNTVLWFVFSSHMTSLTNENTVLLRSRNCILALWQLHGSFSDVGAHQDFQMPEFFMPELLIKELWKKEGEEVGLEERYRYPPYTLLQKIIFELLVKSDGADITEFLHEISREKIL